MQKFPTHCPSTQVKCSAVSQRNEVVFRNWESSPQWFNNSEQQLHSHMSKRKRCQQAKSRQGEMLENNIPTPHAGPWYLIYSWLHHPGYSDSDTPLQCRKTAAWQGQRSSQGGCNWTRLPPKSAAACRLVLRMFSLWSEASWKLRVAQCCERWVCPLCAPGRKRWLMSHWLLPAVKRHHGMQKWPRWSFLFSARGGWLLDQLNLQSNLIKMKWTVVIHW